MHKVTALGWLASLAATGSCLGQDVWRQGSVLSFDATVEVDTSLTIEPGVVATFSNGASLVILPGATLTVNGTAELPVQFGPADVASWNGVSFLPGSHGTVRHLDVRGSRSTSVSINGASPLLEECRFGHSIDDGSLGLILFAGVIVRDSGAEPTIRRCTIESVRGHDRADATDGAAGSNGANGANGTFFQKNGMPGGNGSGGADGADGAAGGAAFGIAVLDGAAPTIESNVIRGIVGGRGGRGGDGGNGGAGGKGGNGWSSIMPGAGGAGGAAGISGGGGDGGAGGTAIAVFVSEAGANVVVAGNAIYGVRGGEGGAGGRGGDGGSGGAGGAGGECFLGCSAEGDGGDGAAGTSGGAGGKAGAAGLVRGVSFQLPVARFAAPVVNNSLALIVPPIPAPAGAGGNGGLGGAGGLGGSGSEFVPDGDDGVAGADASAGPNGASAAIAASIGVSVSGSGAHLDASNHAARLSPGSTMPSVQFRAINGATMQVTASCIGGFGTLAEGNVTFDAATLVADPLYVAPPTSLPVESDCCTAREGQNGCSDNECASYVCGKDASCCASQWDAACVQLAEELCPRLCGDVFAAVSLALQPESPAIDLGSNAEVPAMLLTDLLGEARILDGDGDGYAAVDAGAHESPAVSCGPDLTCDGAVNGADLAQVLGSWGPCATPCAADLDGSGTVDGADLAIVLASWS
ncbi:MAG: hypothetical protein JNM94_05750 [Phycisphaerae bacterium]|nr:hypothetical protein [Phycisphaerae bacterium]